MVRELEHTLKSCLTSLLGENVIYRRHLSPYFLANFQRQRDKQNNDEITNLPSSTAGNQLTPASSEMSADDHYLIPQGNQKFCLNTTINQVETVLIDRALTRAGFNISKAGRFLNLSPQSLRYKIKKLNIHIPEE